MKQTILCFIFALSASFCAAQQVVLQATATAGTCSANGSITASATGGTMPYSYEIIAPASGIRPPQISGSFLNLAPSIYTVKVTAANGTTATATANVLDQYDEPTMACTLAQRTVTMTVTNGRPPFRYEASTDNFVTILRSATSSDRMRSFECLSNGNYAFRVTDACNNIYTCNKVIQVAPLTAQWTCQGTGTIQLVNATGGVTPYTYKCYPRTGPVRNSTNGTFTGVTECRDSVVIQDACGASYFQIVNCNTGGTSPLKLVVNCSNGTLGTASVTASGGTPPYSFRELNYNVPGSANGQFTGLTKNQYLKFEVTDACGGKYTYLLSPLSLSNMEYLCPWGIKVYSRQMRSTTDVPGFTDFSFKPVTYKCISCTPQITKVDAVGDASNFGYFPNLAGIHRFEITNACGEKDTVLSSKTGCVTSDCNSNLYVIQNNTDLPGTTSFTLKTLAGVTIGTNTTGIFTMVPDGKYQVFCTNPNGIPQTVVYDYEIKFRFSGTPSTTCEGITVNYCPSLVSGTIKLYNNATGALITSNTTGSFTGLAAATEYRLIAFNANGIATDTTYATTSGIRDFSISANCTTITCSSPVTIADPQNRPVTYRLEDNLGVVIATNTTGIFPGLLPGRYTVRASHPICGSLKKSVSVGGVAVVCLKPSFRQVGAACRFTWDVVFEQAGRITGGPDNVSINTSNNASGKLWIRQLRPGNYNFTTPCGTYPVELPDPNTNITIDPYSTCPTNGKVTVFGANSKDMWAMQTLSQDVCADTNDVLQIYNEAGTTLIEQREVTAASTTFYNLNAGTAYKIYYRVRDALKNLSCPIDTVSFTMPFYTRPDLTATYGVICNATNGNIKLDVTSGNPPFTYKLLSGPVTRTDVTNSNRTYTFTNLPQGAYTFRVSDTCGISADYSTAVGPLNFAPVATRFCNGCVKLEVPVIANATYIWQRGTTTIGTTATTTVCNAASAATYTVSVSVGACNYTTSVAVTAQTPPLIANAGVDFATLNSTANLAAAPTATGVTGTWTQVAPSSGTTVFGDTHSPISTITVSTNPGIYTYVWSIQSNTGGCIATDTVKVGIQSCNSVPVLASTTQIIAPVVCGGNGSAKAIPSGGVAPYTYHWSNNSTAQTVNLPYGTYTVTIEDASPCGNPVIKTVNIPRGGPAPTVSTINKTICAGSSYTFYGTSYNTAGSYTHDEVSAQGCVTDRITLNLTLKTATTQTINRSICGTETVSFNGQTYSATGTYTSTLPSQLSAGCDSIRYTINITSPVAVPRSETRTICQGETVTINGNNYNTAGVYTNLLTTFGRGCDSVNLTTTIQYLQPRLATAADIICKGDSAFFGNKWHKTAGIYADTTKAFKGCDSILTNHNLAVVNIELIATNTQATCNYLPRGDVQTLTTGGTAPYTYAWTNNLPAQSFQSCLERGIYTVTVTDQNGCKAITPVNIVYNDLEGCLELDEGITPNGDGKNDTWDIPCLIEVKNHVEIYNRWGQLVYDKLDYKGEFDGIYNGKILPDGVYYYVIEINGTIPNYSIASYSVRKGTLTIIRH